jgi:hypothetical protein
MNEVQFCDSYVNISSSKPISLINIVYDRERCHVIIDAILNNICFSLNFKIVTPM